MQGVRFLQRRATAAQWAAKNPVLGDGEFGIEKDTGIIKVGDGETSWTELEPAFESQFLPILGTAADSAKFGGQAPSYYRTVAAASAYELLVDDRTLQASPARKLVSHWGTGTSFPVVGVLSGDTFIRSDIGTNGSNWVYNGGSAGKNGWVHKGPITCTSTTRPATSGASSAVYPALEIFETDTGRTYRWLTAGVSAALWDQVAGPPETYTVTFATGFAEYNTGGWQPIRVFKMGRVCWLEGLFQPSTVSPQNVMSAGTGYVIGSVPAKVIPAANVEKAVVSLWAPGNNVGNLNIFGDGNVQAIPFATTAAGWNMGGSGLIWRTNA